MSEKAISERPTSAGVSGSNLTHPDADRPDAAERVGRFYDDNHDTFLKVYGNVIQAFRTVELADLLDYQAESMGLAAGQRVLDAGCGVAGPAIHFARERGVEVEALTISASQAAAAGQHVAEAGLQDRVHVRRGDYHLLPELYPRDHFDVVYFLESFGHSFDKPRLLEACFEVLKPNGTLYVKDLFQKEPAIPALAGRIREECERINSAYHYEIADLYDTLRCVRRLGFILASLKTIDIPLEKFENLTVSNDFQELTGIYFIPRKQGSDEPDWDNYIFPVDFFEMKCIKPCHDLSLGNSRYFLQNLYHMQVLGTRKEDL